MGWTGIFNWSRSEKNSQILNREFFGSAEHKYEALKWSGNGGHTWCLYKNKETNKVYAMVVLCSRDSKRHEFCYKDIELSSGPYTYDMPSSWIPLIKDTYKDSEFAQGWFKRYEEYVAKKKTNNFKIGDVLKCHNGRGNIEWNGGFKIAENSDFFVMISPHQTRTKVTKLYMVVNPIEDGRFCSTRYRLSPNTFKNLDSVEVVRRAQ